MASSSQPVIVVGASLVGLSAALCLASQQVPTIVLEKHGGAFIHPRAIGFTARTIEIFQSLGLDKLDPIPEDFSLTRAKVESLTGQWFEHTSWSDTDKQQKYNKKDSSGDQKPSSPSPKKEYSANRGSAIPQDQLEPMLEALARERGADIRRQQRVVSVGQDQNGVVVTVLDAKGQQHQVRGSYLIAADGNRSTVRELLQIPRQGRGSMQNIHSVLFHAPLKEYTRGIVQFDINQPGLSAFLTSYNDGRWALMFRDDVERDEDALQSAIHSAIGRTDIPIEIITTGRWELTALVADTFQAGRIFLAGDAAHTLPPNRGGYGANTGIHDVHNLAWKLAAVLSGRSAPELLDTYDAERRPVALLRHDQIFVRADYKVYNNCSPGSGAEMIDDDAMEFGQLYASSGFVGVDDTLPRAKKPDEWAGQPGTHLPHIWVTRDGDKLPLLKVVGQGSWTLVLAVEEWMHIVSGVNKRSSIPIKSVCIGRDVQPMQQEDFCQSFGVSATGAALIRPDGYITWRTPDLPSNGGTLLDDVLSQVAFRT
ncbi:hypothetical protein NUU61_010042 [Penicillium alfredii]|uniref:FAD-binding domain-containing protein n=1 Tax=Penicillium alfredii TaxID=1506179 RepID=A0A9W9JU51_9EURO|nr:uncharacterized protein NUU61_010042 [Penicillium alfredii]KAJ5081778.1 hypothetical protein NUU61_010042 [Penicillium alfredii]